MAEEMEGLSDRKAGISTQELTPAVIHIEACENYQKQSYRNRCLFYAADGVQSLNVPVVHEGGTHKIPVKEIRIDWSKPWLLQHRRAIISAYRTSAYFEYYMDEFFAIYERKPETLLELNTSLLRFLVEKTGVAADIRFTEEYHPKDTGGDLIIDGAGCTDLREVIHPKRRNDILTALGLEKPYFQVFSRKYGFQPDLSAIDLLFNEGPDSLVYLKRL